MKEQTMPKADEIEELPDAWERFEKAFDAVMKAKPKPRPTTATPKAKERPACRATTLVISGLFR